MKKIKKNNLVYVDQRINKQKFCRTTATLNKFRSHQVCKLFKSELQDSSEGFDNTDDDTLTGMLIW